VVLERPALAADQRFDTNAKRLQNRRDLEPLIEQVLGQLAEDQVLRRLDAADVPYGRLNDMKDVLEHPQLAARDRWSDYPTEAGPVRMLKHPMNLAGLPQRADAVPAIGQHTEEVLAELGLA